MVSQLKQSVIKDVARQAGTSVSTVSRVIRDAPYVSEDKRTRVLQAIKDLDYRPSPVARALVYKQPKLIAVIAGNTSRYGYAETIRGIEENARQDDYTVSITVVESVGDEIADHAIGLILEQPVAGIIVLKFDPPGVTVLRHLPTGIPAVAVAGVREKGIPQAVLAETDAAEAAVSYLLDLGHTTVHHVRVPPSRKEDGRTTGWRRALRQRNAPVPPVLDATWDPESGREIGHQLAEDADVTAIFAGNDEIAIGIMRGLADCHKKVPDDISVIGFDDHPLAQLWLPALTTVRQDFAGLGARAYELLRAIIDGGRSPTYSNQRPTLIIRDSTAPPPGHGGTLKTNQAPR